jgi:hypothetical protein
MKRASAIFLSLSLLVLPIARAQAATHSVALTWSNPDSTGVTNNVYRLTGACPTLATGAQPTGFTKVGSAVAPSSYTDLAVSIGVTYCYYVTELVTATGAESLASNLASGTIPPGVPRITITIFQ